MKEKILNHKILIAGSAVLLIIILTGFFSTNYLSNKIETDERQNLLLRAGTIAYLLDDAEVGSLKGDDTDLVNPAYIKIKSGFVEAHNLNKDTRFIYIIGLRDGGQYFMADSEDPSSPDYSYPGQKYDDATKDDINKYISGTPYTKGPYTDSWGNWFTAYYPVKSIDGQVLGMVGIDIDSKGLLLRMSIVRTASALIFGLIFLAVITLILFAHSSVKKI